MRFAFALTTLFKFATIVYFLYIYTIIYRLYIFETEIYEVLI